MKLKDIVKVVLFSALGFVVSLVGSMATLLFGFYGLFAHAALGTILVGAVYVTLIKKVGKRPAAGLFYLVLGLVYAAMGFPAFLVFMLIVAVFAELGQWGRAGTYTNDSVITRSFVISQLVYGIHPLLIFVVLGESGVNRFFPNMFDAETMQMHLQFFSNSFNIVAVIVIQLIACFIGVKIGLAIYHKFFSKTKRGSQLD